MYREIRIIHAPGGLPDLAGGTGAAQDVHPGALLMLGNHPNDLPDVMLGYLATNRPLRYVGTISAASNGVARKVYQALGVIPVARARDARAAKRNGLDPAAINERAGSLIFQAFSAGHVVGVFPEGGVHFKPYLVKPRQGVVKMCLEYADTVLKHSHTTDVTILPFGIQYEAPQTPGTDCIVVFGQPVSLKALANAEPTSGLSPATALASRFYDLLWSVTRNAASFEQAKHRDCLVAARAAASSPDDPLAASVEFVSKAQRIVRIAAASTERRCPAQHLIDMARCLARAVRQAGGVETSARDHSDMLSAVGQLATQANPHTEALTWWLAAFAVPAALGALIHYPPVAASRALAAKLAQDPTDLVARTFLPGGIIVFAWYLVLTLALAALLEFLGINPLWSLALLLLAPGLGDIAFQWRNQWKRLRLIRRAKSWSNAKRLRLIGLSQNFRMLWEEVQAEP